ncbi:hypothetical protein D3C80_1527860 [compost metagenome]
MLLADLLDDLLRFERRQHDVHTAAEEQHDHCGQVGQMEHRHGVQVARMCAVAYPVLVGEGGDADVVVTEHHALGETGGAAGIENAQQGVATTVRVFNRFVLGDQGFIVEHAFRRFAVTGINHQADTLGLDGHLGAQFLESIIDDQHAGLRVVQ